MGQGRGHQTQWAAQFAVASELCKQGYEVALTMGHNTPLADLMCVSPKKKKQFLVDVKGLYRPNPWLIKRKDARSDLYYVLAYVPKDESNQFFVLNQKQINRLIDNHLKRLGRPQNYSVTGFNWNVVAKYKDNWKSLPQ